MVRGRGVLRWLQVLGGVGGYLGQGFNDENDPNKSRSTILYVSKASPYHPVQLKSNALHRSNRAAITKCRSRSGLELLAKSNVARLLASGSSLWGNLRDMNVDEMTELAPTRQF